MNNDTERPQQTPLAAKAQAVTGTARTPQDPAGQETAGRGAAGQDAAQVALHAATDQHPTRLRRAAPLLGAAAAVALVAAGALVLNAHDNSRPPALAASSPTPPSGSPSIGAPTTASPSDSSPPQSASASASPTEAPSTTTSSSPASPALPCKASGLSVKLISRSAGSLTYWLSFSITNTTSTPCTLHGYPTVMPMDSSGSILPGTIRYSTTQSGYQHTPVTTVTLQPGTAAGLTTVQTFNTDGSQNCPPTAPNTYISLRIGTDPATTKPVAAPFGFCSNGPPRVLLAIPTQTHRANLLNRPTGGADLTGSAAAGIESSARHGRADEWRDRALTPIPPIRSSLSSPTARLPRRRVRP